MATCLYSVNRFTRFFPILNQLPLLSIRSKVTLSCLLTLLSIHGLVEKHEPSKYYTYFFLNRFQKYRGSRLKVFYKKNVIDIFAKLTWKHLCQSLYFNKVANLKPSTLLKKETPTQVFSCEVFKIFKSAFLTEHLWLLLKIRIGIHWRQLRFIISLSTLYYFTEPLQLKMI